MYTYLYIYSDSKIAERSHFLGFPQYTPANTYMRTHIFIYTQIAASDEAMQIWNFHWKCYPPEMRQNEKSQIAQYLKYKFNKKMLYDLNLYQGYEFFVLVDVFTFMCVYVNLCINVIWYVYVYMCLRKYMHIHAAQEWSNRTVAEHACSKM